MKDALISTPPYESETAAAAGRGLAHFLMESAEEWKLPPGLVVMIVVAPAVIALGGFVAALLGGNVYKWLTGEDRFAENLQVCLWILAFALNWLVISRLGRAGRYGLAFLYFCLNAGIFLIVGEELSWGQRIFGWATPETLKAVNRQHETNIHSLEGLVDTFRWLYLIIGAYGTILPLLFMRSARHRHAVSMLVPHYTLTPYFLATFAWRIYLIYWKLPEQYYFVISKYSEVIELILAMGFFLFISFQLRKIKPNG
jgi:hypothetical protein